MDRKTAISTIADALDLHEDDVKIIAAKENGDVVFKITALVLDDAVEEDASDDEKDDAEDEDDVPEVEYDEDKLDDEA